MINLIKGGSSVLTVQVFRYLISGSVAFTLDFFTLWILTEIADCHYLVSSILANGIGLIVTYIFSIFWIFDTRTIKNWIVELIIFMLIGVIGAALTLFFMWTITELMGVPYLISKIITVMLVSIIVFVLKKKILFKSL